MKHNVDVSPQLSEFCDVFRMRRANFYSVVVDGKVRIIKCGNTTLITNAEAQRFQAALEAGEV